MSWREALLIACGPGAFGGVTFGDWLRTLRDNRFAVHPRYWGRAAATTGVSLSNSLLRRWEEWRYGRRVREAAVPPPLFVLGIWRSGTTHLHNLLARDDRLAFPNMYQVFNPHTFLTTEAANAPIFQAFMPRTRPQDNVRLGVREPQEDEFALLGLTGLSFAMSWAFPRSAARYDRYLTFRGATPAEVARWQAALKWFVQKLAFKYGPRPLVLKSPGHTARIKLLLELFPDARFVHIHRHPYEVFRSTMHTTRQVWRWWALQRLDDGDLEGRTLRQYTEVFDAYFAERDLIPRGRFVELGFADLEKDPLGQVRRVYEALGLPDFDHVEPKLRDYVSSLGGYKKNEFRELPAELKRRVAREWRRCFREWGYPE
jgi:hypothetical protein